MARMLLDHLAAGARVRGRAVPCRFPLPCRIERARLPFASCAEEGRSKPRTKKRKKNRQPQSPPPAPAASQADAATDMAGESGNGCCTNGNGEGAPRQGTDVAVNPVDGHDPNCPEVDDAQGSVDGEKGDKETLLLGIAGGIVREKKRKRRARKRRNNDANGTNSAQENFLQPSADEAGLATTAEEKNGASSERKKSKKSVAGIAEAPLLNDGSLTGRNDLDATDSSVKTMAGENNAPGSEHKKSKTKVVGVTEAPLLNDVSSTARNDVGGTGSIGKTIAGENNAPGSECKKSKKNVVHVTEAPLLNDVSSSGRNVVGGTGSAEKTIAGESNAPGSERKKSKKHVVGVTEAPLLNDVSSTGRNDVGRTGSVGKSIAVENNAPSSECKKSKKSLVGVNEAPFVNDVSSTGRNVVDRTGSVGKMDHEVQLGLSSEEKCSSSSLSHTNSRINGLHKKQTACSSTDCELTCAGSLNVVQTHKQKVQHVYSPRGSLIRFQRKKLLILDLNGLLADINQDHHNAHLAHARVRGKLVFKRPYYDDFLRFCFQNFELGIWSSRMKVNMDSVVDILMKDLKRYLLFCWDLSKCTTTGLKTLENTHKLLVLKELKKLWNKEEEDLPWKEGEFSSSNTLLVDDSPYKAVSNPPHTAIFPQPYSYCNKKDDSLGPGGDLRVYLENLATADDVQCYVREHPFGQPSITESDPRWSFYVQILDKLDKSLPEGPELS